MRRSDREITDIGEIIKIIEKCDVCRLALSARNIPYIVPMNYGFEYTGGNLVLYFHSAHEGRKLDIIKKNPFACFEMDTSHRIVEADKACGFLMEYESVIGSGKISFCSEKSGKTKALNQLMKNYAKDRVFSFSDHELESVTVFRLDVAEFTAKRCSKPGAPAPR